MKTLKKIANTIVDAAVVATLAIGAHNLIPPPYSPSKHTLEQTVSEQPTSTLSQNLPAYTSEKQAPTFTQTSTPTTVYVSPEQQLSLYEKMPAETLARMQEKIADTIDAMHTLNIANLSPFFARKQQFYLTIGPSLIESYNKTHSPQVTSLLLSIINDSDQTVRDAYADKLYATTQDSIITVAPLYLNALNIERVNADHLLRSAQDAYLYLSTAREGRSSQDNELIENARAFIQDYASIAAEQYGSSRVCNLGGELHLKFPNVSRRDFGSIMDGKPSGENYPLPRFQPKEDIPLCNADTFVK